MPEFEHIFNWSPAPITVIKNEGLRDSIEQEGYAVVDLISPERIEELRKIYFDNHQIEDQNGGMFYSVYSQDVAYRKRVHDEILGILKPAFDNLFIEYNNAINFFINKLSGEQSGFSLHQDSSAVDEFKHSTLSVWIPLQNVDESNGALWLIEKTHQLFSPFRSVSFAPPFANIIDTLASYLQPIPLEVGQALLFDSRVVHTSGQNTSGADRIAIVSGILPKMAEFQLSYQETPNAPIELYRQANNFLIDYPNFFHNCTERPHIGTHIGEAPFIFPKVKKEDFESDCATLGIPKRNLFKRTHEETKFITEPTGKPKPITRKNVFQRLFS